MADLPDSDLFVELDTLSPYIVSPSTSFEDAIRTPPPEPTLNYLSLFTVFGDSPEQTESDISMLIGFYEMISDPTHKGKILRCLYHLHYHYAKLLQHTIYGSSAALQKTIRVHEEQYPKAAFFYCEDLCISAKQYGLTLDEFSSIFDPSIVEQYKKLLPPPEVVGALTPDLLPSEDTVDLCSPESVELVSEEIPATNVLAIPQLPKTSPAYYLCPHQFRGWLKKTSFTHTCSSFSECITLVNATVVTDYIESMALVGPSSDQVISYRVRWNIIYMTTRSHIYMFAPSNHRLALFISKLHLMHELLVRGDVKVYSSQVARSTCVRGVT